MRTSSPPTSAIRIGPHDLDVLDGLSDHRFLSVPQAAALYYPDQAAAERRLRKLVKAGLAVKVFMGVRPWSRETQTIYGLGRRGARLLTPRHNGIQPRHLTTREERSALHLEHTLHRNDVRICLEQLSVELPAFSLIEWQQEPERVRASVSVRLGVRRERRVQLIPDGVAIVKHNGQFEVFAIEVDRATVPVQHMWRRYRAYHTWWREGLARARYGNVPYRVLTLVPDEKRLQALATAAARAPERGNPGSQLFWFATLGDADIANPQRLLGPVWRTATVPMSAPRPLL